MLSSPQLWHRLMAELIAARKLTCFGKEYRAGEVIPASALEPKRVKQLIEQRHVIESRAEVRRGPGRPRKET